MIWIILYPVLGLVTAGLLAWFDRGDWSDGYCAFLLTLGSLLAWPILGSAYGFVALQEAGYERRARLARERDERESELRRIERQLEKEGVL